MRAVVFEGADIKVDKKGNPVFKIQDANDDGLSDMVAKFEIPALAAVEWVRRLLSRNQMIY